MTPDPTPLLDEIQARADAAATAGKPYYSDDSATLWHGDALAVLQQMPDESVDCIVTSPPYFGLRDYGVACATVAHRWRCRMKPRSGSGVFSGTAACVLWAGWPSRDD